MWLGGDLGSEAGSYLRLIDFVYHSTLGLRVIKKKKKTWEGSSSISISKLSSARLTATRDGSVATEQVMVTSDSLPRERKTTGYEPFDQRLTATPVASFATELVPSATPSRWRHTHTRSVSMSVSPATHAKGLTTSTCVLR